MKRFVLSVVGLVFLLSGGVEAQSLIPIAEIQGNEFRSPRSGQKVKTRGVVTALRESGFYIQTPDGETDDDPKTSEGIYVYTREEPPSKVKVGHLVEVTGTVLEYRPLRELYGLFLTELTRPSVDVLETGRPLPKPVLLTKDYLDPKGNPDQLEPLEGMRVRIEELLVTAPTGGYEDRKLKKTVSSGVFYGVLGGTPRPFREPGLEVLTFLFKKLPPTLPVFDMNPEMLRLHSGAINGAEPIDVATGATIKNITGIMDYGYKRYTVLIDPADRPTVEGGMKAVPASPAGRGEVTVAAFNLENFFDDENNSDLEGRETKVSEEVFERRLKKTSLAVREILSLPDLIGVSEVENREVLEKLAARINADAKAAGRPDPRYEARLEESNDPRGIDVGFLVKTSKLRVTGTEQIAAAAKLDHPDADRKEKLFSRPPFLISVETDDPESETKFAFTAIVNHFKSYRGIDDPKDGDRVRHKRRRQAEVLARFVHERQRSDPDEKLIVLGDLNAFQFNDGFNDLVGTLTGAPFKSVLTPAQEVFETGLVNLVDHITPESRYSYIYDGSAQALDHILINRPLRKHAVKFGYARSNADFPEILANDENRPERVSDHDVAVLYLRIGEKPAGAGR